VPDTMDLSMAGVRCSRKLGELSPPAIASSVSH